MRKKFRVTRSYLNTLTGEFEAGTAKEAEAKFDNTSEEELENNYIGLAHSQDIVHDTIELAPE